MESLDFNLPELEAAAETLMVSVNIRFEEVVCIRWNSVIYCKK